jgi:hypothetical protein
MWCRKRIGKAPDALGHAPASHAPCFEHHSLFALSRPQLAATTMALGVRSHRVVFRLASLIRLRRIRAHTRTRTCSATRSLPTRSRARCASAFRDTPTVYSTRLCRRARTWTLTARARLPRTRRTSLWRTMSRYAVRGPSLPCAISDTSTCTDGRPEGEQGCQRAEARAGDGQAPCRRGRPRRQAPGDGQGQGPSPQRVVERAVEVTCDSDHRLGQALLVPPRADRALQALRRHQGLSRLLYQWHASHIVVDASVHETQNTQLLWMLNRSRRSVAGRRRRSLITLVQCDP